MSTDLVTAYPVAESVDELLAGASDREPMKTFDSLSGAPFERVVIDGERYVVKYLSVHDDWIQRATGDVRPRVLRLWESGHLAALPDCFDPVIVGAAWEPERLRAALLMPDVGHLLVPEGDAPLPEEQHCRFIEHMATLHAHYWGFEDNLDLLSVAARYGLLTPAIAAVEEELGSGAPVPGLLVEGWVRLTERLPSWAARLLTDLAEDPWPLAEALARTPSTFIHGDWKAGNLGSQPDGRTILLDWAFPSAAPATTDLTWYIGVNCDRLPESKEATIERYRAALEARGVDTSGWWEEQLGLTLLGGLLMLGWSKWSDPVELGWWVERADAARHLLQ